MTPLTPAPESPVTAAPTVEELVHTHLPLVGHVVRETLQRVPGHIHRDDLVSAGMAALVGAARSFDPARGVAFGSYAVTRVRGALVDELRGHDWASRSVRRRARELEETRAGLTMRLGRRATDAEVASAHGLSVEEVTRSDRDVNRASVLSLQGFGETPIDDLLPTTVPSPEEACEKAEQATFLAAAVAELPERLRTVVEGYFLSERPMAEIATELGVTESRISQMRAEALVLLREVLDRAFETAAPASTASGVVARRRTAYFAAVDARFTADRGRAASAAAARGREVAS